MLAVVAIASSAAIYLTYREGLNNVSGVLVRHSFLYIQKLSLSGIFLVALNEWRDRLPIVLDRLATHAFAIYFIHVVFVLVLVDAALWLVPPPSGATSTVVLCSVILLASAAASLLVSTGFKAVFGRYSRMLTGA